MVVEPLCKKASVKSSNNGVRKNELPLLTRPQAESRHPTWHRSSRAWAKA